MDLEKRILTTNSAGLIALLLERLMENFTRCICFIDKKEYTKINELNNHSRAILTELLVQFNGNDKISLNLREVNIYINKLMTEGGYEKDPVLYENCINTIRPICEGFQELEIKEKPKSVTGLTYGKNNLDEYTLTENRSFQG